MTDAKRLFDKSPDELREAFVQNRFGESAVFGLANIETWLQYQRTVERPDAVMWQPFLTRDWMAMCAATASLTHLHERATRQHTLRGERDRYWHCWRLLSELRDDLYLGHQYVGIYAPIDTRELYVLNRDERDRLTVEYVSNENSRVGTHAVVDVLFAEWDHQRPKWREARQFLCDALAKDIASERAKAEADFDTAVAVSADGTKIVHAEWVVVWDPEEFQKNRAEGNPPSVDVRPAHVFAATKARRDSHIMRSREPYHPCSDRLADWQNVVDGQRGDPIRIGYMLRVLCGIFTEFDNKQRFIEFVVRDERRRVRIFITPTTDCPFPLPGEPLLVSV